MRLPPLALAAVLAGCASTAPADPIVAPPVAVVMEVPEPEPVGVVEPEIAPIEPVGPPEVEKLRIDRRAVYPDARATEWTLANGLVVVFVEAEHDGVFVHVDGDGGLAHLPDSIAARFEPAAVEVGPLVAEVGLGRRVASGHAETLGSALAAVRALFESGAEVIREPRPSDLDRPALPDRTPGPPVATVPDAFDRPERFRVVLSAPLDPAWAEAAVAPLATILGRDALPVGAPRVVVRDSLSPGIPATVVEVAVEAGWADLPSARILESAFADRADVTLSLSGGTLWLRAVGASPEALFADLPEPALLAARAAAERAASEPAAALAAFADLYAAPGAFRPAHRPAEAAQLANAIARTPPARAAALLRRLDSSPDRAVLRHD